MEKNSLTSSKVSELQCSNSIDREYIPHGEMSCKKSYSRMIRRTIKKISRRKVEILGRPKAPHNTTEFITKTKNWNIEDIKECTLSSMIGLVTISEIESAERELVQGYCSLINSFTGNLSKDRHNKTQPQQGDGDQ